MDARSVGLHSGGPMRTVIALIAALALAAPTLAQKPKKAPKQKPVPAVTDGKKPDAKTPEPPAATPAPGFKDPFLRGAAAKPPVKDVVARMQKFYETTADLHAKFEQEVQSPIRGTRKLSGDV